MTLEEWERDCLPWSIMEGREATGILWSAALYVRESNPEAWRIMNELRDELIIDMEDNGESSWAASNRCLYLYWRNNVETN